jgi:hypothetical protein
VGAATAIAAQLPGDAASNLLATAGDAFSEAMGIGLSLSAALAAVAAVVVARFLPTRELVSLEADEAPPTTPPLADAERAA